MNLTREQIEARILESHGDAQVIQHLILQVLTDIRDVLTNKSVSIPSKIGIPKLHK